MGRDKRQPTGRGRRRLRCHRCGCYAPKDLTSKAGENWSARWEGGRVALVLCPLCQTPAENAEAEANAAGLTVGGADGGQFLADPVLCITGTPENPGAILYGRAHLLRISAAGQAENLAVVSELPPGTRCVPMPGGVLIYPPR
ncbi:hypothetical protein ACIQWY_29945 [Streptomyces albidoflavus]